jgi:hypothetical protein
MSSDGPSQLLAMRHLPNVEQLVADSLLPPPDTYSNVCRDVRGKLIKEERRGNGASCLQVGCIGRDILWLYRSEDEAQDLEWKKGGTDKVSALNRTFLLFMWQPGTLDCLVMVLKCNSSREDAFVVKVEQRARCHGNRMVVLPTEEDMARLAVRLMGPRTSITTIDELRVSHPQVCRIRLH